MQTPDTPAVAVDFTLSHTDGRLTVVTARPDWLPGVAFLTLPPAHPLAAGLPADAAAQHPLIGDPVPVWVGGPGDAGTTAMGVPAHDEAARKTAEAKGLPIVPAMAMDFGEPLPDAKDVAGVVVIGYDPQSGEYMGLKNGDMGWLVGGGIEDGETFDDCARRELAEEAGFEDVIAWIKLGDPVYSYYYNDIKKSNRRSLGHNYLAILDRGAQKEQRQESHEAFTVQWTDFDSLYADIKQTGGGVHHWLEALRRARDAVAAYTAGQEYRPACYDGEGVMINSGVYDGLSTEEARVRIIADLRLQPGYAEYYDDRNPVQAGKPLVERIAVQAIVQHPQDDTFLLLRLKGWETETYSLPMGGIDDEEDVTGAAMRELREEAGYDDHGEVRVVAPPYFTQFYHEFKRENRRAKVHTVATRLRSLQQLEIDEAEQAIHEPLWVGLDELQAKVHGEGVKCSIGIYRGGTGVAAS